MYPEDRVLVGVMTNPRDLDIAREQHWYRIPASQMNAIHAEYVAFYFTKRLGPDLRWAIHFYARRTGHELVRRVDLLPDEPDHHRAKNMYYRVQLGELRHREPPIVSQYRRRITFIHTTWDRFIAAEEINDLYSTDDQFVDRLYHTLKGRGIQPERAVSVHQGGQRYNVDIVIPCRDGAVLAAAGPDRPAQALALQGDEAGDLAAIEDAVERRGGPLMIDAAV
jgi:catechol 2,3-dioxygenase-like lactoylglutathione lyase family enzyme